MSLIDDITPRVQRKVYDLVREAGLDVADWSNWKNGKADPARNPRYCYQWAFVQGDRIVLNLWLSDMKESGSTLIQEMNWKKRLHPSTNKNREGIWKSRAKKLDDAVHKAHNRNLSLRVIVCDGKKRDLGDPDAVASKTKGRLLDPVNWTVRAYNEATGDCILERGGGAADIADQFVLQEEEKRGPQRLSGTIQFYARDAMVRKRILERSKGFCEYCGEAGFRMTDGRRYLETHHVIPLSEEGSDHESNVVALCANHHRQAHHHEQRLKIRSELLQYLSSLKLS